MKSSLDKIPEVLTSAKYTWILRLGLAVVVGLIGLMPVLLYSAPVRADSSGLPVFQDTSYPGPEETIVFPTDDEGYPGPEDPEITVPPFVDPNETVTVTATGPAQISTPIDTPTTGPTLTKAPDTLATENAEMSDSQVTPPGSETPAPSMTPFLTATGSQTILPAVGSTSSSKGGGLSINWGLFWIGFSLPVLIACGGILYLLDRRPDLFRRH